MYKKAMGVLVAGYAVLFGMLLFLAAKAERIPDLGTFSAETGEENREQIQKIGIAEFSSSPRRVVDYVLLEQVQAEKEAEEPEETALLYPEEEIEVLERIVEAEAGGEDADGKLLVANVVLNRVADDAFPDTIRDVVFQRENGVTQFSPVANGRYDKVIISDETIQAVERALQGEDLSDGALYFAARKYADSSNMRWFDENLTFLFRHGGHEFFR